MTKSTDRRGFPTPPMPIRAGQECPAYRGWEWRSWLGTAIAVAKITESGENKKINR